MVAGPIAISFSREGRDEKFGKIEEEATIGVRGGFAGYQSRRRKDCTGYYDVIVHGNGG